MQYTPVYKLTGYQITETYSVEDVTYTAEITIGNLGFSTGMAGYDPYSATMKLTEIGGNPIGTIHFRFPMVQAKDEHHPKRMLAMENKWLSPRKREFSKYGERMMKAGVLALLEEQKLFQTINRSCTHFSFNCS